MKKVLWVIFIIVTLLCVNVSAQMQMQEVENASELADIADVVSNVVLNSEFDSGNGSKASPYTISNAEQLLSVAELVNVTGSSLYFKLVSDIDLQNAEWTPIGTSDVPFSGGFDGNSHTIRNLKITLENSYNGFFGHVNTAKISKLSIENMTISIDTKERSTLYAGLLAGRVTMSDKSSKTTIDQVAVSGNINVANNSSVYAGGIIGSVEIYKGYFDLSNCISKVDVTATSRNSAVHAGGISGAFVGELNYNVDSADILVNTSYYSGFCTAIAKTSVYCGGIAGEIWGNGPYTEWHGEAELLAAGKTFINNCFADGKVYASGNLTVDAGRIYGTSNDDSKANNCAYVNTQEISAYKSGALLEPNNKDTFTEVTLEEILHGDFLSKELLFDTKNIWGTSLRYNSPYLRAFHNISQAEKVQMQNIARIIIFGTDGMSELEIQKVNVYEDDNVGNTPIINIKDLLKFAAKCLDE